MRPLETRTIVSSASTSTPPSGRDSRSTARRCHIEGSRTEQALAALGAVDRFESRDGSQ